MSAAWARRGVLVVGALVLVVVALGVGLLIPSQPALGAAVAAGVLLLGITAAEPAAIPLAALPLLLVVKRVSAGGLDLSVSDAVLAVGALAALIFAPRPYSPTLRNLLWLNAAYQFATLFTVITNPFAANTVEWVHAWTLISGSLLLGWAIGRRGFGRLGLTLFLLASLVMAGSTIAQGVWQWYEGDRGAVYTAWPWGMHKNMVGCVMGFAAITVFARPPFLDWARRWLWSAFGVFVVALLFTQSRQAIVALGLACLWIAYRQGLRGRGLAALVVLPVLVVVATLVQDQFESGNKFNSAFQRVEWLRQAMDAWAASPWLGHGLRYWYRPDALLAFQPPNAELEVLATAGLVGLVFFMIWLGGSVITLLRVAPAFGTAALALVLSRVVQAQFDLFWVAVQTSIPFALTGVLLSAEALAAERAVWMGSPSSSELPESAPRTRRVADHRG